MSISPRLALGLAVVLAAAVLAAPVLTTAFAQETLPPAGGAAGPAAPPTDHRHWSYALGLQLGSQFRKDAVELDIDSVVAGVKDGLSGAKPKYPEDLCAAAVQNMYAMRESGAQRRNAEFLAANAKAEGVTVLPSGLQYKVLARGTGPSPKATDTVRVNYVGRFIDGEMFDESGAEPAEFQVDGVIPAWTEALQLMKVGDKWQLFVPSKIAYGEDGGGRLPPFAALIFEVELLSIQ